MVYSVYNKSVSEKSSTLFVVFILLSEPFNPSFLFAKQCTENHSAYLSFQALLGHGYASLPSYFLLDGGNADGSFKGET